MLASSAAAACVGCTHALPIDELAGVSGTRCPRCQCRQSGRLFRAARPTPEPEVKAPMALEGEACCFQHPTKRAAVPCDSCGRFLCSLCQFSLGLRNLCATCIVAARRKDTGEWVSRRLNLDAVALATATLPVLGVWTTIVGGPMAIYLGIRALRQAPGPIPRGRSRAVIAIGLGGLQVLAWAVLLLTIFGTALFRGGRLG